jgi:hypothetical protein
MYKIQRLEVSDAVRVIYIYIYIYDVSRLRVKARYWDSGPAQGTTVRYSWRSLYLHSSSWSTTTTTTTTTTMLMFFSAS